MLYVHSFLPFEPALVAWHNIILADSTLNWVVHILRSSFAWFPAHASWPMRWWAMISLSGLLLTVSFGLCPSCLAFDEALSKWFFLLGRLYRWEHRSSDFFLFRWIETCQHLSVLVHVEAEHLLCFSVGWVGLVHLRLGLVSALIVMWQSTMFLILAWLLLVVRIRIMVAPFM